MPKCYVCQINYYYYDGQYCINDSDFDSDSEGFCENCSRLGLSEKDFEEVYCKSSDCYQKIIRREKYCSDCQIYCLFGSCRNKIPKTSNYCDKHSNLQFLVKQKTSLSNPQEVIRFGTWFNSNCATCIDYGSYYRVFLILWEPAHKGMPEISPQSFPRDHSASWWGSEMRRESHSYLTSAQREAEQVRNKLKNHSNPILMIFSSLILRFDEGYSFEKAGVKKFSLSSDAINDPDQYIKPLDIVKVEKSNWGTSYKHAGIYLGDNRVCHVWDPDSKSNNKVRIDSWGTFLKNRTDYPVRYHSIIPFKNWNKIIEQIAKAVVDRYREGNYDILGNNCEHFTNMVVYGLDFSQQGRSFVSGYAVRSISVIEAHYLHHNIFQMMDNMQEKEEEANVELNLESKINETNNKLDNLAKYKTSEVESKIREIKGYSEDQWKALIEVPLKEW